MSAFASDITVCVPVYNGAATVGETLASIALQTLRPARVLVSDDCSTDNSVELCRGHEGDVNIDVIVHPERRGWVANVNALIAAVETPFFCITPHDDLLHPDFLQALHEVAVADASASCVYPDLVGFGSRMPRIVQHDIRGGVLSRALEMLLHHESSVAFRGLVRRDTAGELPLLPETPSGYQADTAWLMTLALRGELRRVPRTLYAKRYAPTTVHAQWRRRPRAELVELRAVIAATCAGLAHRAFSDQGARDLLTCAALLRTFGVGRAGGQGVPRNERETIDAFLAFSQTLGVPMPYSLRDVLEGEQASVLRAALEQHRSPARVATARRLVQRFFG